MKMTIRSLLLASFLTSILFFVGCNDDEVTPVELVVQLSYPEVYASDPGAGIEVVLSSTTGGQTYDVLSDASGTATFEAVIPGTYTLGASQNLDATQALTVTGVFNEPISLNAQQEVTVMPNPVSGQSFDLELSGSPAGSIVFKEVYYTGVPDSYFSDQFLELYNNSGEVIFLDGLYIADIWGVSGQINPTSEPTPFQNDTDHVYANSVWQIPGTGQEHALQPGQSVIIAQDGIDHTEQNDNTTVDLSNADWETYNERDDNRDVDSPSVPNLNRVYFTGGFDWLVSVFGPALVIFRSNDFESLEQVQVPGLSETFAPRIKIPNNLVIDTFEALQNSESGNFQRIPAGLDAGFVYASGTYTGESFRRKLAIEVDGRKILQDLNNSSLDFEKLEDPTPGQLP